MQLTREEEEKLRTILVHQWELGFQAGQCKALEKGIKTPVIMPVESNLKRVKDICERAINKSLVMENAYAAVQSKNQNNYFLNRHNELVQSDYDHTTKNPPKSKPRGQK